mgnify:CR=1 FL=1
MTTATLVITMYSDWLIATNEGQGLADASPVKDVNGLPYIPGRSIRGLLRDATRLLSVDGRLQDEVFGTRSSDGADTAAITPGQVSISDAVVTREVAEAVINKSVSAQDLYTIRRQTSIESSTGTAQRGSLRSIEVVIPGLTLIAEVAGPDGAIDWLKKSAPLVQHLGHGRSRGLGRCRMQLTSATNSKEAAS